jgi:hypothetical protein
MAAFSPSRFVRWARPSIRRVGSAVEWLRSRSCEVDDCKSFARRWWSVVPARICSTDGDSSAATGGVLHAIRSDRRLAEEKRINVAYRWFLGLELTDSVPHFTMMGKITQRQAAADSLPGAWISHDKPRKIIINLGQ